MNDEWLASPVTCLRCGKTKTWNDMTKNVRSHGGRRKQCKVCSNEVARIRYDSNFEKYQDENRRRYLKRKYGITQEEYLVLVEAHDGRCAICHQPPNKGSLVVDHCHDSGKVRGLLCISCNRSIGGLGDSVEGVMRAVRYLEAASGCSPGSSETGRKDHERQDS
jgi:hypothetical protein